MYRKRKVAKRREPEDRKRPAKGRKHENGRKTEAVKKSENRMIENKKLRGSRPEDERKLLSGRRLKSVAHGQEGNKKLEGIRRWRKEI
jgi:hypothetical protein